jgi:hypothetical protein
MRWNNVKVDGLPPCDSETVYVGINSAGYCGCFNSMTEDSCWYDTPEDAALILSELLWWKPLDMPGDTVPDQIKTYIAATPEMKIVLAENWSQMNRATK